MTAILRLPPPPDALFVDDRIGRDPDDDAATGRAPAAGPAASDDDVSFRQLRHHTKNALQRILCHVSLQPGLNATAAGRALARDLERRIHLVAAISDALFGLTRAPDPLEARLRSLGESLIELLCDPGQLISLDVEADGMCPGVLDETVVRVAHELLGNAVKHGMHVRLVGRIEVRVTTQGGVTRLTVSDDGWGYANQPVAGEGLSVARILAEQYGGRLNLRRERDMTHVTLVLPPPRPGRSDAA
jgi:two-component sensor histidine kinase